MEKQIFYNGTIEPSRDRLKQAIGNTFGYYDKLNLLVDDFMKEWKFYPKTGWIQKVFDKRKALFYFVPMDKSFKISMTIRSNEKANFLVDPKFESLQDQLENAKKYPEGYFVQFLIKSKKSYGTCKAFLEKLIVMRNQKLLNK